MTDEPRVTIERDWGDGRTVRIVIPQGKQSRFLHITPAQARTLHQELGAYLEPLRSTYGC